MLDQLFSVVVLYILYKLVGLFFHHILLHYPVFRLPDCQRRAVFITGCDSGFGAALARRLDGLGVPVFAGCLTEEGMKGLKDGGTTSLLKPVLLDVTKSSSIQNALNFVQKSLHDSEAKTSKNNCDCCFRLQFATVTVK